MWKITDGILMIFLFVASWIDIKKKQLPFLLLLIMSFATLILRIFWMEDTLRSTIGGIFIGLLFWGISKFTQESIGYGDSWIIILLGIYLGGMRTLEIVFIASVGVSIFSIMICVRCGWKRNKTVPFVPFLTAAYLGVVLL